MNLVLCDRCGATALKPGPLPPGWRTRWHYDQPEAPGCRPGRRPGRMLHTCPGCVPGKTTARGPQTLTVATLGRRFVVTVSGESSDAA